MLCVAQVLMAGPWEVHARPPLPRSMQALAQRLHCASCALHRPGGVLLRQNPTASEISDARFRAIYSGMRKLPPYWGTDISRTAFLGSSDRPFRHQNSSIEPSVVLSSNPALSAVVDRSRKSFSSSAAQGKSLYTRPYAHPDLQSYDRVSGSRF